MGLTNEQIDAMEAGRELDAAVHAYCFDKNPKQPCSGPTFVSFDNARRVWNCKSCGASGPFRGTVAGPFDISHTKPFPKYSTIESLFMSLAEKYRIHAAAGKSGVEICRAALKIEIEKSK